MSANKNNLVHAAVELRLLVFSPVGRPFPARNGGQPGEVIIDARGAASNLPLRSLLIGGLLNALSWFPSDAVIGGVATGGLVLAAQLALVSGRPFVTILPEGPRLSGLQRSVEGDVRKRKVVLFDNVATTGTSLNDAAGHVASAGGTVAGALVIATYGTIPPFQFPFHVLLNFRDLINAAHEAGIINSARRNRILKTT